MIQATFIRTNRQLLSVELTGHAGSGEFGYDIVCAAVSTLSINLVNSLEALTNCTPDVTIDEIDGGYMKIALSDLADRENEKVQLLFESFLLGMTNLAENSSEFVSISVIAN
ncbi:ribosomal-processing cysteine protease Prp [Streptococcus hyovaginalis]|uniref:ribosomal-processing cysteine protease Prp n=1 Tax=Streptococcus hyovaginalis TaxID=149015 RepID=UPI00040D7142|nr:ribosomal-processing cysteine protease Prp [Streptococcus hyovaginalis]